MVSEENDSMLLITSVLSLLCTARYTVVSNVDLDLKNEPVMNKSSIFGFREQGDHSKYSVVLEHHIFFRKLFIWYELEYMHILQKMSYTE